MLLEAPQRPSSTLARHPTGRTPSRRSQASRRVLADEARGRRCRRHHLRLLCNPPCPSEIGRSVGRLPAAQRRTRTSVHEFLHTGAYASCTGNMTSRVDTMLVIPSPHTLGRTFYTGVTFSRRCDVAVHTGVGRTKGVQADSFSVTDRQRMYSTRGVELRESRRWVGLGRMLCGLWGKNGQHKGNGSARTPVRTAADCCGLLRFTRRGAMYSYN